jgi:TonB family protein
MRINPLRVILALAMVSTFSLLAQDVQKKASHAEAESAVMSKVPPEYPAVARQLKIQGVVELEAVVTGSGEVEKVNIVSGNPVLTKPAVEALKKWKFKPFTVDGKVVTAQVPVSISFKL